MQLLKSLLAPIIFTAIIIACNKPLTKVETLIAKDHLRVDTVYFKNGNIKRIVISDNEYTKEQLRIDNGLDSAFNFKPLNLFKSGPQPKNSTIIQFDSINNPIKIEYNTNIISINVDSTQTKIKSLSFQRQSDSTNTLN